MNKHVKYPLVLASVALCSGLLLATTYALTKDPIEKGKIERQTGVINDMFTTIKTREIVEVPSNYKSKGIESIIKVNSNNKDYYCYTITFKDSTGGDVSSVVLALDTEGKIYNFKFLSVGDSYAQNYNNKTYIASLKGKDKFDTITSATFTGNDLNKVLGIALDCQNALGGKQLDDIDKMFETLTKRENINVPTSYTNIKTITKVTTPEGIYYAYNIEYVDTSEGEDDNIKLIVGVKEDKSNLKIRVLSADGYVNSYNNYSSSSFDTITGSTLSGNVLQSQITNVLGCHDYLTNEYASLFNKVPTREENVEVGSEHTTIKKVKKLTVDGETYYAYHVEYIDPSWEEDDNIKLIVVIKDDKSELKIKVVEGDYYIKKYDNYSGSTTIDNQSGATLSGSVLNSEMVKVLACHDSVIGG